MVAGQLPRRLCWGSNQGHGRTPQTRRHLRLQWLARHHPPLGGAAHLAHAVLLHVCRSAVTPAMVSSTAAWEMEYKYICASAWQPAASLSKIMKITLFSGKRSCFAAPMDVFLLSVLLQLIIFLGRVHDNDASAYRHPTGQIPHLTFS